MPSDSLEDAPSVLPHGDISVAHPRVQLRRFVHAVHIMKMYAAGEGLEIAPETRKRLAGLVPMEAALVAGDSANRDDVVYGSVGAVDLDASLELAMAAHTDLAKLVAPATPESIAYTEPPTSVFDFARRQTILFLLVVAAIVAVIGFVGSLVWKNQVTTSAGVSNTILDKVAGFEQRLSDLGALDQEPDGFVTQLNSIVEDLEKRNNQLSAVAAALPSLHPGWPDDAVQLALMEISDRPTTVSAGVARLQSTLKQMRDQVNLTGTGPGWRQIVSNQTANFFAAMLGAAFFTLYTANRYVVCRTFDRTYTTQYVVRFVLGIVSGMILANFGEHLTLPKESGTASVSALTLTQTLLALIGGYSADAVNAVFTRVAETLTTLVRGDSGQRAKDDAQAEVKRGEAAATQKLEQARLAEERRLRELRDKAAKSNTGAAVVEAIDDLIKKKPGEGKP
ncbi:MAG: hypothetical protein ACKVS8_11175 [Phycisphaerales bacterium]